VDAGDVGGGIVGLHELTSGERRTGLARDFREKFNTSIDQIGLSVSYPEAWDLILTLRADPSSWFHASISGWDHPLSYEAITLRDMYDMQLQLKSRRKIKPYPRPWSNAGKKFGASNSGRSAEQMLAILRPNVLPQ
jgi:hypothetical protein